MSAGSQLYRLSSSLGLEETGVLTSEAMNISLSNNGRWLVVCLTDLSCEVYNATNFSAGPGPHLGGRIPSQTQEMLCCLQLKIASMLEGSQWM